MLIGYARTSTIEQQAGLEAQVRDLMAAGCSQTFSEQISSVKEHRPMLEKALAALGPGDVLVVTKPDRLARSTMTLLKIVAQLESGGAGLILLSMGGERLDTRNPTSKLMLTILAGVATWEREIMLERQREGVAKAHADGKYKGRPALLEKRHSDSVKELMDVGVSGPSISVSLGISIRTVDRIKAALKAAENGHSQEIDVVNAITIPRPERVQENHPW